MMIITAIAAFNVSYHPTGTQLRGDDPLSLKQIITLTTAAAAAATGRLTGAAASARMDFLSDVRLIFNTAF
jgi:hypothetical protein